MNRRSFLALSSAALCGMRFGFPKMAAAETVFGPYKLSLAEWSLVNTLHAKLITNLDFPRVAKEEYGIDAIEFVDQFFSDKAKDMDYLGELKKRAGDLGVYMHLIMLDTNGPLGTAREKARRKSIEKTFEWIDAAKFLDCRTVRVNARGEDDPGELAKWMAESCAELADYAAQRNLNVVIENHGGPSSDPAWLTGLMKTVNKPNFGILPDFGNFPDETNRYDAVEAFLPWARGVSAKATQFTDDNLVKETDFFRMLRIVRDSGFSGYIGIESGGEGAEGEKKAIIATRELLKRIFAEEERRQPIFNGKDLSGWVPVAGGEWTVENGVLVGRNGQNWSTDPERSGSWLRTERGYGDFRLEPQYNITAGGNSGVMFRSALEKNPSFTGYEMQILDFHGAEPTKQGAGAIYDTVAPSKNLVRPAGEWNTVTIIAKGNAISFDMNGERVLEANLDRSAKGYIGLQNHDQKSEVRFKNIRIEEL
jgi:L-ribulose-5-phosphate 3-epimerase